jgi:hypothetical protein
MQHIPKMRSKSSEQGVGSIYDLLPVKKIEIFNVI